MLSRDGGFAIPTATIEFVRRHEPGNMSVGDYASARLEPGLVAFLETPIAGSSTRIGAGYHAPFNVAFGAASTAAVALGSAPQLHGIGWVSYDIDVALPGAADAADTVLGHATVLEYDAGLAVFRISARTASGRELLAGRIRLRAMRDGKPTPTSLLTPSARRVETAPRLAGYATIASVDAPAQMVLGQIASVSVAIANDSGAEKNVAVSLRLPYARGLSIDEHDENSNTISIVACPHSLQTVQWNLRADRPDEVNHRQPWPIEVIAECAAATESHTFRISVPDRAPGRVFYVLTEDCETFDGGPLTGNYGASSVLGNANNFMDPEDYRIQMIEKPDRMNQIAEHHGARWTHFWCVPQRFAVDWAAARSATGHWPSLGAALDESIRHGGALHEYAPHIHFDYEPDSAHPPQPRLLYDSATDGILPNQYYDPVTNPRHHYHDWDGSARGISYVKQAGDLNDSDSKTGSLRKCLLYLARMQANRRCPVVARTGGFDFGVSRDDQRISTAAFEANGLLANADVRTPSTPRGNHAYFCDAADRFAEVQRAEDFRLVQLAVTHDTDFLDPASDNAWFSSALASTKGPGVHVIAAMAHAMFMRGQPDAFRSLEGGSFSGLDRHLAWVRATYPGVRFATASEALAEYIDYYTPRLVASVVPILCGGNPETGIFEYPIRLLGKGIRIDRHHPAGLTVRVPAFFEADEIAQVRILSSGEPLHEANGSPVSMTLQERPKDLRLQVTVRPESVPAIAALFKADAGPAFQDPPEPPRPALFQLREAGEGFAPGDVLRLLMNPVAGGTEPLGRRMHPIGAFFIGAALTAALEAAGEEDPSQPVRWRPLKLRLSWRKAMAVESDTTVDCRALGADTFAVRIRNTSGDILADSEIELAPVSQPA